MTVLLACVAVPLAAGLALVVVDRTAAPPSPRTATLTALAAGVATLAATTAAVVTRPELDRPWVRLLGLRLHLGVDGISAPLLVLTAATGLVALVHSVAHPRPGREATFLGGQLLVVAGALATFLARDAVLLVICFELVLVPMWLLLRELGDEGERDRAAARFVLYTALGSTLLLVGVLALVLPSGTADLQALAAAGGAGLNTAQQTLVAALILTGLAVKVPVLPLHSWLPSAHTAAPTPVSVLLAAVLLKTGTYAMVRLVPGPLPAGLRAVAPVLAGLAALSICWSALVCLREPSLKRLVAWSSIGHMGFVVLAIATGSHLGLQAALYGNVAHGVVSALLFLVAGWVRRHHGHDLLTGPDALHGLREDAPRLGSALVLGLAASMALPGLAAFWGEALALLAAWDGGPGRPLLPMRLAAGAAAVGAVLTAGYVLRVLGTAWMTPRATAPADDPAGDAGAGERGGSGGHLPAPGPGGATAAGGGASPVGGGDVHGLEWLLMCLLMVAVVVLGVAPGILLRTTDPAVTELLRAVTP